MPKFQTVELKEAYAEFYGKDKPIYEEDLRKFSDGAKLAAFKVIANGAETNLPNYVILRITQQTGVFEAGGMRFESSLGQGLGSELDIYVLGNNENYYNSEIRAILNSDRYLWMHDEQPKYHYFNISNETGYGAFGKKLDSVERAFAEMNKKHLIPAELANFIASPNVKVNEAKAVVDNSLFKHSDAANAKADTTKENSSTLRL